MIGYRGTIDIEGWHDPVMRDDREIEGQVHALNHLKAARGGSCPRRGESSPMTPSFDPDRLVFAGTFFELAGLVPIVDGQPLAASPSAGRTASAWRLTWPCGERRRFI